MHVLGELASAGTISVACSQAVRLVRIVLDCPRQVQGDRASPRAARPKLPLAASPLRRLLRGTPSRRRAHG